MIPLGVAQSAQNNAIVQAWGDTMLTSYRALNPDQAKFFDCTTTADYTSEAQTHGAWYYDSVLDSHYMWDASFGWREMALSGFNVGAAFGQLVDDLLHARAATTYLVDTFGPLSGSNEADASKFYILFCYNTYTPNNAGLLMNKTGAVIHWEWGSSSALSGTLDRDYPQTMTVPSNGGTAEVNPTIGFIQMSSTDGWSGVNQWKWQSTGTNKLAGAIPTFNLPSFTSLDKSSYAYTAFTQAGKCFYTYHANRFPTNAQLNSMTDTYHMFDSMELGDFSAALDFTPPVTNDIRGMFYGAKLRHASSGGSIKIACTNVTDVNDLFGNFVEMDNSSVALTATTGITMAEGLFYELGGTSNFAPSWDSTAAPTLNLTGLTTPANEFNGFADDMLCYEANFDSAPPSLVLPAFTGGGQCKLWINSVFPAGGNCVIDISAGTVDHMFVYLAFSNDGFGTCSGMANLQYVWRCDWFQIQENPLANLSGLGSHANFIKMFWNNSVFNAGTLDAMYTSLPDRSAQSAATIFIAGCPGAATSTKSIATAKNWVVDDTTTTIDESYP